MTGDAATSVTLFMRRSMQPHFSIERVFADVRGALPPDIEVTPVVLPFESRGILRRVGNLFFAWRRRGTINHISGDVHYLAFVLPRGSLVLTVHDLASLERLQGVRRYIVRKLWYDGPVRRARSVTAISQWTRDELVAVVPHAATKTTVIRNPLAPLFHARRSGERELPTALQVGTFPNKNLPRVVSALEGLPVHLRIVGKLDEQQRTLLEDSGIRYSNVWGLSDEALAAEYASASFLVFASLYEGFGLPILEAQACGCPVITSHLASMPEVAGDAALFVDPMEVDDIRQAVRRFLDDAALREELIERGFANVARFSPGPIAEQYAALYRTLRP